MTAEVQAEFIDAVDWLDSQNVSAITGDCGFMEYFQQLVLEHTSVPVFMSSLIQLPILTQAYTKTEKIAMFTANSTSFKPLIENIMPNYNIGNFNELYSI